MRKVTIAATLILLIATMSALSTGCKSFDLNGELETWFDHGALTQSYQLDGPASSLPSMSLPVEWNRTYGGHDDDYTSAVEQTIDGGYALAGYTYSYGNGSNDDFWLVKTDSSGIVQWNETYGGLGIDEAYSLIQTNDGGYALAGFTNSFELGNEDFWLVKTDSSGNMQWNKTYGGSFSEEAEALAQTFDNGYIIAGDTESFGAGYSDFWLVKTDSYGNMQWNRTFGGTDLDVAYSIEQTVDGGYIVAGYTSSFGAGSFDVWLVKLAANGDGQWARTYGGINSDISHSVRQTADGGYLVAGSTSSSGAGLDDFFLVKTDDLGNQRWNKTYGGTINDRAFSLIQTKEGGCGIAGATNSLGHGSYDFWLVKTDLNGYAQWNATYGGSGWDSAESIQQTADAGYVIAGYTFSDGAGGSDAWLVKLASADVVPPLTINDYDGLWHNTDFTVTVTATDDLSGVAETYYKVNGGSTEKVNADGQPRITLESANNTLAYWSVDNAGHEESPRVLAGIKLDKTPPAGSFMIKNGERYVNSSVVDLVLSAIDATSGVYQVRYSNDGTWDTEAWEAFSQIKLWALLPGDGDKTVYYQIMDTAGLVSVTVSHSIFLDTTLPVASQISPVNAERFSSSTVGFNASAIDIESGISKVELYVDDQFRGNMAPTSEGFYVSTVSALSNGDHTWLVKAYSGAGSTVESQKRAFTIQTGEGTQGNGPDYSLLFYVAVALAVVLVAALVYYIFGRRKRRSGS